MRGFIVLLALALWGFGLIQTLPEAQSFGDGMIYVILITLAAFLPAGLWLLCIDVVDAVWRKLFS